MEAYLYDDLYELEETHWWHRAKRELVLRLLRPYLSKKRINILDVGCGTGKNVETFAQLGTSWGIDMAPQAIAYCKRRGLTRVRVGVAQKTGFGKNFFDVVTLLDVLEHTDDKKVAGEMQRIVGPGGFVVITVPAYRWLWSRWDEVLHHKRRYEPATLTTLLATHGFIIRKISFVYSFLVVPAYCIRLFKSFVSNKSYGSDFQLSSPFINWILLRVSRIEAGILEHVSLPFGTSLVCVAQKRG